MENSIQKKINYIIRNGAENNYQERWNNLYNAFDKKYNINSKVLYQYAIDKGVIKKSMSRVEYICTIMKREEDLYDIAFEMYILNKDKVALKK